MSRHVNCIFAAAVMAGGMVALAVILAPALAKWALIRHLGMSRGQVTYLPYIPCLAPLLIAAELVDRTVASQARLRCRQADGPRDHSIVQL